MPSPPTSALEVPGTAGAARSVRPRKLSLSAMLRVLIAFVALAGGIAVAQRPTGPEGPVEDSLASLLAADGLHVTPGTVTWIGGAHGLLGLRPALLIAAREGELSDVYFVEVRAAASGRVLDTWWLTNLTASSSADESQLVKLGPYAAFAVRVGERYQAVTTLDLRGEPDELTADWPLRARIQNAISNLQTSGRARGFGRVRYGLEPASAALSLSAESRALHVQLDHGAVKLDPERGRVLEGGELASGELAHKGKPGTITWLVDSIRNLSFVGAAPIEWLEHTVFGITDRATRAYREVVKADTEAEVRAALVINVAPEEKRRSALTASDPELRWPPPPLPRVLTDDEVQGEGEWLPVTDEFVASYPGAPPTFYQTFIRVDPERTYTRVYITLWDPRQTQLHVAMGTQEPVSATGETGSGRVPRDPQTLKNLVAGFNGGFQALHGEFGAMAEGRVYLPPKPFAATVAVLEDGRVGVGSWPGPGREAWDEERANAQIPADMISFRQNLTSVVENGEFNPWKRWWWGAAPTFSKEQTYIHRSGLCLTREGYLAYLWGESMGPEELGAAMQALRCVRGMHLDMNSKHTGFELYRTFAPGDPTPPIARELDADTEHEGPIADGLGYRARARLAIKTMSPLAFPRYLARDRRDFFFLTRKPVLPGPALRVGGHELAFSTTGLPHAGWPHAFARAAVGDGPSAIAGAPDAGTPELVGEPRVWLVRIDATRAVPAPVAGEALDRPLAQLTGVSAEAEGAVALFQRRSAGLLRYALGKAPADARVVLRGEALGPSGAARALALDDEGFLLYAEAVPGAEALLAQVLEQAGVMQAVALPAAARLAFVTEGGAVAVNGTDPIEVVSGESLAFLAETRPAADVMFADVQPKPYRFWGHLQDQRVRYFPQGPPRFRAPEGALPGAAAAPGTQGPTAER